MFSQLTNTCLPPAEASPGQFRISGAIFLVAAAMLGAGGFALSVSMHQPQLLPPLLLLPMIVWLVGTHRILWGGTTAKNRWLSSGRIVVTTVVGYVSLMAISALLGTIAGLIKSSAI